MFRFPLTLAVLCLAPALAGCFGGKSAVAYYDECSQQTSSFTAMAACGKQRRNAVCQPDNSCSRDGDAMVAYADSLVASVSTRTMSEPEAQRKWIEFKMARQDAQRAAARDDGPMVCNRIGSTTVCN
jgi:hypothetical protein